MLLYQSSHAYTSKSKKKRVRLRTTSRLIKNAHTTTAQTCHINSYHTTDWESVSPQLLAGWWYRTWSDGRYNLQPRKPGGNASQRFWKANELIAHKNITSVTVWKQAKSNKSHEVLAWNRIKPDQIYPEGSAGSDNQYSKPNQNSSWHFLTTFVCHNLAQEYSTNKFGSFQSPVQLCN